MYGTKMNILPLVLSTVGYNIGSSKLYSTPFNIVTENGVRDAYGFRDANWGDLSIFQGDYINFGYWQNISLSQTLTQNDRINSSAALYKYVISKLNILKNDTVLELGCGRAVGMLDAFEYIDMKKIIGIDITDAQIERANTKKERAQGKNILENLEAENLKQSLDFLEKKWELTLVDIKNEKKEFRQEISTFNQRIESLENKQKIQRLIEPIELSDSNIKKEINTFQQE